jgi:predicted DNA-binding transcriptional regulator YafY
MKADRLLSMLLLLQAHGRLTGRQLAARLEVSERTVHRDMEALCAAGVPVYALRGSQGGWQLEENWRTQVPGLDASELQALLLAQPRALGDARLAHAAERALAKLMASLPATMQAQAASMRQRLHVDSAGWRGTSENLSMLPVVQDAVSRDRRLAITYWRRGGECVERTIDPLGLVAKGSTWYLVARTADGFRTYRVSRIEQATLLELPCERPADFDLAAYWTESTARFDGEMPRYYARLRIEPQTARWLKMWRVGWSAEEIDPPPADGWVTLRMQFDREEEACFVVLGLGPRVDVLEPDSLRARIVVEAAALIERTRARGAAANTEGGTV